MRGISSRYITCCAPVRAAFLLPAFLAVAWAATAAAAPTGIPPEDRGGPMVLLSGGTFLMGSTTEGDHSPAHPVRLDPFYIDRYEVTNARYEAFCRETKRPLPMFWGIDTLRSGPNFPDHPVVGVSWVDAKAFAEWAGKRLPTEAEWEYAARGGLMGREYVSADTLAPGDANYTKAGRGGTVPVGSYRSNGFGLYDMGGNVLEWVNDWYAGDAYANSRADNPKGPEKGKFKVIRGGGWHTGPGCSKVHVRNALPWGWLDFNVGFRCARDVGRTGAQADSLAPPRMGR